MMPPKDMINKNFLQQVLSGKKRLLKQSAVRPCNPPNFGEIGVKKLYDEILKMEDMHFYFPDSYSAGRQCNRTYLYNVWNTLHPNEVKEVIDFANNQRYSKLSETVKKDSILITEEWQ